MIPSRSHPRWKALVTGQVKVHFKFFAGNMMLSQCERKLARDASPAAIDECIVEAHEFFTKYERVYGPQLTAMFPETSEVC